MSGCAGRLPLVEERLHLHPCSSDRAAAQSRLTASALVFHVLLAGPASICNIPMLACLWAPSLLCRWVQQECRALSEADAPEVNPLLQQAAAALRERPVRAWDVYPRPALVMW